MLISLSYHSVEDTIVVVTRCSSCRALFSNESDSERNWISEDPVYLLPITMHIYSAPIKRL